MIPLLLRYFRRVIRNNQNIRAIGDQPESVELRYQDENIWLTQRLMAELYGVEVPTINEHIQKIYADRELDEEATIWNFRIDRDKSIVV